MFWFVEKTDMPRPLSNDIRIRVVQAYDSGDVSYREVAERFDVAFNSVVRWVSLFRNHGDVSPRHCGSKILPKIRDEHFDELKTLIAEKPDRTLEELALCWNQQHDSDVHRSSIHRALNRAGITRKKNFSRNRAITC